MQLAVSNIGRRRYLIDAPLVGHDDVNEYGDSDRAFGWSYAPQARLWLEARCA